MRKLLTAISVLSLLAIAAACGSKGQDKGGKGEQEQEQAFLTEESPVLTELKKVQLPCDKDSLYNAWKRLGTIEVQRRKTLDYTQHTPTLFLCTDLDQDGLAEVLLRAESPYAAIFTVTKDSLRLLAYVNQQQMGMAVTPEGDIIRSSIGKEGTTVAEFIRLKKSQPVVAGAVSETFTIKGGTMVSEGKQYQLLADTGYVQVSREEYEQVAPQSEGTFIEDIEGWDDFRKP